MPSAAATIVAVPRSPHKLAGSRVGDDEAVVDERPVRPSDAAVVQHERAAAAMQRPLDAVQRDVDSRAARRHRGEELCGRGPLEVSSKRARDVDAAKCDPVAIVVGLRVVAVVHKGRSCLHDHPQVFEYEQSGLSGSLHPLHAA